MLFLVPVSSHSSVSIITVHSNSVHYQWLEQTTITATTTTTTSNSTHERLSSAARCIERLEKAAQRGQSGTARHDSPSRIGAPHRRRGILCCRARGSSRPARSLSPPAGWDTSLKRPKENVTFRLGYQGKMLGRINTTNLFPCFAYLHISLCTKGTPVKMFRKSRQYYFPILDTSTTTVNGESTLFSSLGRY